MNVLYHTKAFKPTFYLIFGAIFDGQVLQENLKVFLSRW
jgi:hypothetical protein